jgi:hypothetical protein
MIDYPLIPLAVLRTGSNLLPQGEKKNLFNERREFFA